MPYHNLFDAVLVHSLMPSLRLIQLVSGEMIHWKEKFLVELTLGYIEQMLTFVNFL